MLNPYIPKQSLWTGITREGGGLKSHVRIKPSDIGHFPETSPVTGDGINAGSRWLPLLETSEIGLRAAQEKYEDLRNATLGRTAALSSQLTLEGCWVSNEFKAGTPEHAEALWEIADLDIKHPVLDTPAEIQDIHVCDDDGCLNPRHYNFTPKIEHRQAKARPEYAHFNTNDEIGIIIPYWYVRTGEYLPSVEESLEAYLGMRALCSPYTDGSEAPLSANGVSKIAVDPITGCWVTQTYYLRPLNDERRFQYDGYGRLGVGKGLQTHYGLTSGQQVMAHRLMAWQYGILDTVPTAPEDVSEEEHVRSEINHKCGTRHCCNPGHLEQVSHAVNVKHSQGMRLARRVAAKAINQPALIP